MNRLRLALLPVLAGALFYTAEAQPQPPAPPAPPAAPRAPRPPRPPKPPKAPKVMPPMPWSGDLDAHVKEEIRRGLAEGIAEVEGDDSIPPAIKNRILRAMRKAQASGDPSDLAELSDLSQWSQELSDAVTEEVEKELRKAGIQGGIHIGPHGNIDLDLGELQGNLDRLRALAGDDEDDPDDEDDVEAFDDQSADSDLAIDLRDLARDRAQAARDRARAARDRARAARDRDAWGPFGDDFGSPFDNPDASWLKNLPFAEGALGGEIDIDIDVDLDDLNLDRGVMSQLDRIAADEEAVTSPAQRKVMDLTSQLKSRLAQRNPNVAEINRLVDAITAQEAEIRKARLGALIRARQAVGQ